MQGGRSRCGEVECMARTCPKCGSEIGKDTAAFCNKCGRKLDLSQPDNPASAEVLSGCSKMKKPYVIRFEYQQHGNLEVWVAAKTRIITAEAADRGGFGSVKAKGDVWRGAPCPFCGATSFFEAHDKLSCFDGIKPCPCAWCNEMHNPGGEMTGLPGSRVYFE